jgi:hypothetical protein
MNNRQLIKSKTMEKITALYERLSVDDALDGTSNSIVNQQKILEDYAVKNGFMNIRHFQDDGWSGTRWDRPGWEALIAEIEAGNVATVIVKDMSRVGRDYLQVGFYTEVMFRKHGVRFIAVSNNIDSENKESAEFAPFLNLMSEWYARDCSRKVKTVLQAKGNSGKRTTTKPIYGYKVSPDDKDLWIVNEETAPIIQRIFQMTMDGMGSYQIARKLAEDKIPKPSYYSERNSGKASSHDLSEPYTWHESTVRTILYKPEYAGHTVNFRTSKESYKDKHAKYNPKKDWKYFYNTHEPIVEQSVFDTVQKLLRTPRRVDTLGEANPLTGVVFCADCEAKMYNRRTKKEHDINKPGRVYKNKACDVYDCSTYKLSRHHSNVKCSGHHIRTEVIRELVLDMIRSVCHYAKDNQAEFIRQVQEESTLLQNETEKSHKKAIVKNERRIAELENLFRKIYEDNAKGELNDKRFKQMSSDYEREEAELETQNAEMQSELDAFTADNEKLDSFIGLVKKYTEFEELTTAMLNEFVHKVFVHKAIKNEWGERIQKVDIIFNFIGEFKLPIEDEAEWNHDEVVAEEKRREKLRKQREANRRCYAKQKKKKAAKSA